MDHANVASAVVTHYRRDRRDLPWRRTRDPYAIWVSEIMLQQTRVATVIPYWERWMAKFPTVRALAAAPLDDVLAAWAGLGYYSRARNLHAGAQALAIAGELPKSASELRAVRGIGPYTAGAIASIAYGERTPLVDGNVARVLARLFAITDDIKSTAGQKLLWQRAGALMAALPSDHAPGDLNQGLMELGATLCSPTSPRCLLCPLAAQCEAARTGRQDELPVVAARKKESELPILARAALWMADGDRVVLARRAPDGLFGGLWELPQGASRIEITKALGVTADATAVAYHDQTLSHRRLRIAVFRASVPRRLVATAVPGYDAISLVERATAKALGIAAATAAILSKYEDSPWSSIPKRSLSSPRATKRSSKASTTSGSTRATTTSSTRRSARRKGSTSSSTTRSK
ncbi:MAG TPA: A/G-specific adenine glycosylase [Kofleriaceae bacterium]|nr:A/G-specific adenine glycosylase [Kofleriaceae bacterium]